MIFSKSRAPTCGGHILASRQPLSPKARRNSSTHSRGIGIFLNPRFSVNASPCKLTFDTDPLINEDLRERRVDVDTNCAAPFSSQTLQWRVLGGKILLQRTDGNRLAELGGNPDRLSGDLNAPIDAVILERKAGSDYKRGLVSALRRHKCYYLGYSAECADDAATRAPQAGADANNINILVDLNVRSQPRRNAAVVGVVPRNSKISVNLCLEASDGVWCRAGFGEVAGWMAKSVIRDEEWPVITFIDPTRGVLYSGLSL